MQGRPGGPSRSAFGTLPATVQGQFDALLVAPVSCPVPLLKNSRKTNFLLSTSLFGSARSFVFFRVGAISAVLSFAMVSSLLVVRKAS